MVNEFTKVRWIYRNMYMHRHIYVHIYTHRLPSLNSAWLGCKDLPFDYMVFQKYIAQRNGQYSMLSSVFIKAHENENKSSNVIYCGKRHCLLPGLSLLRFKRFAWWCFKVLRQQHANGILKPQVKRSSHLAFTTSSACGPGNAQCSSCHQTPSVFFYNAAKKPCACLTEVTEQEARCEATHMNMNQTLVRGGSGFFRQQEQI